ncbi:hypothetical protein [Bacillus sp. FJAT-27445]|uniref:hypothetical protein n=1 Tax=Bacillus sp. FJAT-27445 TaxID=1679166 RepID=UPI000743E98A|nr:hypothetical protein [Bacillus sp. FJAT-27445]
MAVFNYFVLGTLIATTLASITLSFLYRKRLTHMAAMALSMAIGMNTGIAAGIFFGFFLKGNLFASTILSVVAGITAGASAGIAFGLLPIIEGVMAGLMGGMMGAMLGEMVPNDDAIVLLKISLTLSVSSLLLFFILPKTVDPKNDFKKLNTDLAFSKSNNSFPSSSFVPEENPPPKQIGLQL